MKYEYSVMVNIIDNGNFQVTPFRVVAETELEAAKLAEKCVRQIVISQGKTAANVFVSTFLPSAIVCNGQATESDVISFENYCKQLNIDF